MQFEFLPEITMEEAVKRALQLKEFNGIGTYGERLLHSALKMYFCPEEKFHEGNYKGFVADIFIDKSRPLIIEVQTRQLFKLQRKLEIYGDDVDIVIVFPILAEKKTAWIDPVNGNITKLRRSPKKRNQYSAFRELYGIKKYLMKENISVCLPLISCEEYRWLDGWSEDRKKGAHRAQVVPLEVLDMVILNDNKDYLRFLPSEFQVNFTAEEYSHMVKVSLPEARCCFNILSEAGVICECGKQGRKKLWERTGL